MLFHQAHQDVISQHRFRLFLAISSVCLLSFLLFSSIQAEDQQTTTPDASGRITGRVTDEKGQIISIESVSLYRYPFLSAHDFPPFRSTVIDSAGYYTFSLVGPGIYRVRVEVFSNVYSPRYYDDVGQPDKAKDIPVMGNPVSGINVILRPSATITGSVQITESLAENSLIEVVMYEKFNNEWVRSAGSSIQVDPVSRQFQIYRVADGVYRICTQVRSNTVFGPPLFMYAGCYQDPTAGQTNLQAAIHDPVAPAPPLSSLTLSEPIPVPVGSASDITVTPGITIANLNLLAVKLHGDGKPIEGSGIAGRVTDPQGHPLPGIRVVSFPRQPSSGSSSETYTNLDGYYLLQPPPGVSVIQFLDLSGSYLFQVYDQATDLDQAKRITFTEGSRIDGINASLTASSQITGLIQAADAPASNPPLAPFSFTSVNLYRKTDTTWQFYNSYTYDTLFFRFNWQTGDYTLRGLTAGTYRMEVQADLGVTGQEKIINFYGGDSFETASDIVLGTSQVYSNVNIALGENNFEGSIRGRITANHAPAANLRVDLYRNPGSSQSFVYLTTDASGYYTFTDLLNGVYSVQASDPAHQYATTFYGGAYFLWHATPLTITGQSQWTGIDIDLAPSSEIRGTLRRYDGKAVAGATAGLEWRDEYFFDSIPRIYTTTDSTGRFLFPNVAPITYRLFFIHPSFNTAWHTIYYGNFDPNTGFYTPTDFNVTPGTPTEIDMIVAAPTASEEGEEPTQLYVPMLMR